MRRLLCAALIGGLTLTFFIAIPAVGEKASEKDSPLVTNERRQAFAWMTNLGYPETKELKFVLVATGDWLRHGNDDPENRYQYGFLMEEKGNSFKIQSLDLEDQEKPIKTLQEKIADELARTEMWRAVVAFGDPQVPRPQLQERFDRIAKNFPKSEYHARASEISALLKQMIKEDEEHAALRKKGKPFDQLTRKEQIAELVFQLRDQPGEQISQQGSCDIFMTFSGVFKTSSGGNETPAHRLVEMGYDAVPQLVEVIEDKRFSRAVGFHRSFYFSHEVLRVGECAQTILEKIAGMSFNKPVFAKDSKNLKARTL